MIENTRYNRLEKQDKTKHFYDRVDSHSKVASIYTLECKKSFMFCLNKRRIKQDKDKKSILHENLTNL